MDELSFLKNVPLFSNLTAKNMKRVVKLRKTREFAACDTILMDNHPRIALQILPIFVERFRETNEQLISMKAGE